MSLQNLDRAKLKLILQTSQGFPGQSPVAKAKIASNGKLLPGRAGHAITQHLQGAASAPYKTKFRSLDAMAEALERLLQTPAGQQALANLRPAQRQTVAQDIRPVLEVEALVELMPPIRVTFTSFDMAKAGMLHTHVVAVLEGRARKGELYLHVQTCYPKLAPAQIEKLLDSKRPSDQFHSVNEFVFEEDSSVLQGCLRLDQRFGVLGKQVHDCNIATEPG